MLTFVFSAIFFTTGLQIVTVAATSVSMATTSTHQHREHSVCDQRRVSIHGESGWNVNCSGRDLTHLPKISEDAIIIDLSNNHLKILHDDSFIRLSRLMYLNISRNDVTTIQPTTFRGLGALLNLNLSYNKLSALENNSFLYLTRLTSLDLTRNKLEELAPMSFGCLGDLKHLDLSYNELGMLYRSSYSDILFACLKNTRTLKINGNGQIGQEPTTYPISAIHTMTSLRTLVIDGPNSNMSKFDNRMLAVHLEMLVVDCTTYSLDIVSSDFFKFLPHLLYIEMKRCRIEHIDTEAFRSTPSLNTLDLTGNHWLGFSNLAPAMSAFANSSSLRTLILSNIARFHSSHPRFVLRESYFNWMANTSIETLDLSDNHIAAAENLLIRDHFPSTITHLYFNDNDVEPWLLHSWMHEITSKLKNLRFLNFNRAFSGNYEYLFEFNILVPSLQTVLFQGNFWRSWYLGGGLSSLTTLDLSKNDCNGITDFFFTDGERIQDLDVSDNGLAEILISEDNEGLFRNLSSLKRLDVSRNSLRDITPKLLFYQKSLEELVLKGNSLAHFNLRISHLKKLTLLDLSLNRIRYLDSETRKQLDNQGSQLTLDLTGNEFGCTCDDLPYLSWIKTTPVKVIHEVNNTCPLRNGMTSSIPFDESVNLLQKECAEYKALTIFSLMVIAAYLLAISLAIITRYRWKLQYMYYLSRAKYYGHDKINLKQYEYDAFVSYSDADYKFVTSDIVNQLEDKYKLRLCLHQRDFIPGNPIADNILKAIHNSSHVIIILSRDFVESHWCRYEFHMSLMETVCSDRDVLIMVDYRHVPKNKLPAEIAEVLAHDTYITYYNGAQQETFWKRLYEAVL